MIQILAVANYRSLRSLVVELGRVTVVTGANGAGKSNLYRSLRLLSEIATGGATGSLAREGGLESVLWAGPQTLTSPMQRGEEVVQGQGFDKEPVNLRLGFTTEAFGYAIDFGLPVPSGIEDDPTMFANDPIIKRESIWHGSVWRPAVGLVERHGPLVMVRGESEWEQITGDVGTHDSLFTSIADARLAPEVLDLRDAVRSWRFYDQFRTDRDAPARQLQVGTLTRALDHDGGDLASVWQTIREIGDAEALEAAVDDGFPGAKVKVTSTDGRFGLEFRQEGLLRPLTQAELSDGTLRYLLWCAALLAPSPPSLLVLNEPENSLHEDLIPALARLILVASKRTQVWVVSHSPRLTAALEAEGVGSLLQLEKVLGETTVAGRGRMEEPMWVWPRRT